MLILKTFVLALSDYKEMHLPLSHKVIQFSGIEVQFKRRFT